MERTPVESRFNNGKGKEMTRKIEKSFLHTSMCNLLWPVYRAIIAVRNTGQCKDFGVPNGHMMEVNTTPPNQKSHTASALAMKIYRGDHPKG